ncbi:hypothetical protein F4677DRAFT_338903 [Hypoxylon crocopeplum]|nr:hypothetical protein F4677DRAFT_338903 [Hypoxylon crocopeplum]
MASVIFDKRQDATPTTAASGGGASMALSTGAIAGIAVGGAVVLFAALASLLVKIARRRERRRASEFPEASMESGAAEPGPKRLRKKSVVGDQVTSIIDKEDEVGREESRSRHSSIHIPSPARTRQGSLSRSSFAADGSGRGSTDTQLQKQRSPEKEKGYGVYQHRRKTSWIDEDALHGPTITSPKKAKQKHRRKVSWFDGGLGRSLSRLSTRSGMGEVSPTLPYTETGTEGQFETPVESPSERSSRELSQDMHFSGYGTRTPRQSQQQQVYTSPQKPYGPIGIPSPSSDPNEVAKSPPDIIHNPRYRNKVSFQAAQQLAGGARLPPSLSIPLPLPLPQSQPQRQPILKHSATDTELAEILRMTAERLQDGNRSARRQTMMTPYSSGRLAHERGQSYFDAGRMYEHPSSGEVSPVKSHKSAPATLAYAELEGSSPQKQVSVRQMQTPRHSRQISHMSQISQVSMLSEPDSLVAYKRESLSEVRTALSSPSRVARSTEPTPSPQRSSQQARPFSYGSSMSSALSTLYSMEEASIRSPPAADSRLDSSATETPRRGGDKILSAFDMLNGNPNPEMQGDKSPKFRFEEGNIPPPLRIRRGTLGGAPDSRPMSRSTSHRSTGSTDVSKHRSTMTTRASNNGDDDDPFTVATPPPQNPARLSKVFSPLLAEMPSSRRSAMQPEQSIETPTPSPTRRTAMRSPRTIINSPPRADMETPGSPVISEAGLSSVYDSYTYTHGEPHTDTATDSTETLPTTGSEGSPTKPGSNEAAPSIVGFRIPDYLQPGGGTANARNHLSVDPRAPPSSPPRSSPPKPRRSMPSDGSAYSQHEDSVPPMRAPTTTAASTKRSKSVRMSTTITELRRMNSQISTVSEQSMASPTLPVMRGGGFSPGRQSGGGKNYLLLGGGGGLGLRSSGHFLQGGGDASSTVAKANSPQRGSMARARRGTIALQGGLDTRKRESEKARKPPREGGGGGGGHVRTSAITHAGQLMTHATKLKSEEVSIKRSSVESLYDTSGFLKDQS